MNKGIDTTRDGACPNCSSFLDDWHCGDCGFDFTPPKPAPDPAKYWQDMYTDLLKRWTDLDDLPVQPGAGEREAIIRECAEKVQSYLGATTESKRFGDEAYAMLAAFSRQAPHSSSEGGR